MSERFPPLRVFLLAFAILSIPAIAFAVTDKEVFRQGIKAANSGDFPAAVEAFNQAKRMGMQGGALYYNLAVSYYRLEKYELAYDSFSKLTNHPNLAGVAAYNLGLTAEKLQRNEDARKWFSLVPSLSNDQALHNLSEKALQKMDDRVSSTSPSIAPRKPSRWGGLVSFEVANNDNIGLDPDIANLPRDSQQAGTSGELLLTMSGYLAGNSRHGLRISGSINQLSYLKEDYTTGLGVPVNSSDFDLGFAQLSLSYDIKLRGWRNRLTLIGNSSKLGGKDFQQTQGYELRTDHSFSKYLRLLLSYRYTGITSKTPVFDHLDGDKNRFRLDLYLSNFKRKKGKEKIRLSFIGETNDRTQPRYSPDRRAVRIAIDAPLGRTSMLNFTYAYRFSKYKKMVDVREDDRFRIGLEYRYTGINGYVIYVGAVNTENESFPNTSTNTFNYEERIFYTGVSWYY